MVSTAGFFLELDTLGPLFQGDIILERTEQEAEGFAPQIEEYAKLNAPWEDRTGDARAGLTAEVDTEGEEVVISLSHSVGYGLYLETIESGQFAIIMPTLEHFAPLVFFATNATQTGEDLIG